MRWVGSTNTRRLLLLAMAPWVLAAAPADVVRRAQTPGSPELRIKIELLDRFARFTEWPADALTPGTTFDICLEGSDELFAAAESLRARSLNGHAVELRRVKGSALPERCHLLFLTTTQNAQLDALLTALRGKPVLTVGDRPGLAQKGVHINLLPDDGQLKFEVNLEASRQSSLKLSSRLLRLARIVPEGSAP